MIVNLHPNHLFVISNDEKLLVFSILALFKVDLQYGMFLDYHTCEN